MKTASYLTLYADDATCIYRATVIELIQRGYRFSDAKAMVRASGIVEDAKRCWRIPRDMDEVDWADYVLDKLEKASYPVPEKMTGKRIPA